MSARTMNRPATQAEIAAPIPRPYCLDGIADLCGVSRRSIERLRAAGRFPKPDFYVGKLPRWKPETIRLWMDQQARVN